jgi:MSHA pilin protein MshD
MTLIELIMFIVIVSVGVAGILAVMNVTVKSSSDPMVRKQALSMAEAILDEVLAKDYSNPAVGGYTETDAATCANRVLYDDVGDYSCFDGTTDGKKIHGNSTLGATAITALSAYRATIAVVPTTLGTIAASKITVTVTGSGETIALSGYRANY